MVFDPFALGLTAGINGIVGTLMKVAIEAATKKGAAKSQDLLNELPLQLARTAHQYAEKYYNRHGLVKALGMNEPMSLDDLYIAVNVLSNDLAKRFASLQDQEELYKTQRSQSFHAQPEAKRPGIDVANAYQYLMVLGGPGIGKSTFLRRMGLEALKGSAGAYQHQGLIPVLLELRSF
jgi:predicted ATPase with chaperone activity